MTWQSTYDVTYQHNPTCQRNETTSFFFTNFPNDVKASDLWSRFARFARVGEVYIPNKVDKQGHRFGFVKFRDVRDAKELLRRISDIWVGSFRLRVNLSKLRKNPPAVAKDVLKAGPLKDYNYASCDKSFQEALLDDNVKGGRSGGYQGEMVGAQQKSEVVWEVEVEDEVVAKLGGAYVGYLVEDKVASIIQNQFRMDGFQNLKVCALGFRKILLWSDKVGEVKEVVETVGWWCSLFERIVPWSPSLVSTQRVTWIRCLGVPLHAWGLDLFRAVAFKFGRFIEIDEQTKLMLRCDVARVKILLGELKLIDSSLAIKVQGQRFDIRIVEETGGWGEGECCYDKRGGVVEDESSKASVYGGASVAAVMEGFSETGSDADVSESCQVLVDVESGLGVPRYNVREVSESNPNFLGNPVKVVEALVNADVDNRRNIRVVESACSDRHVGCDKVGSSSGVIKGTTCDSKNLEGRADKGFQNSEGHVDVVGPAQFGEKGMVCNVDKGGSVEVDRSVPKVLRTRDGDLYLTGPSNVGPSNFLAGQLVFGNNDEVGLPQAQPVEKSFESFDEDQVLAGGVATKTCIGDTNSVFQFCSKKLKRKYPLAKNMPFNLLRKLPRSCTGAKKGKKKRGCVKARGRIQGVASNSTSDSIQYSGGETNHHDVLVSNEVASVGLNLEVVLPFQSAEERSSDLDARMGVSGVGNMMEGGGFVVEDPVIGGNLNSLTVVDHPISREGRILIE
ncbi:hypothetical protein TSUD_187270 [Trifolium subterraneum]|uniref:RRM domain-containing protein n=1 Tax=Trifolium subterraneum TaxID=3900 RepID=A0A2Z6NGN2_TRISU|nr:hypothetical protein TSUD_187270 [Trifolium subterraneum]